MADIKYTEDHEAIYVDGDVAAISITDYAIEALGDLVFVELPEVGRKLNKGDEFSVVESIKIASEIYTPVAGTIIEVNEDLEDDVDQLKEAVDEGGWIVKIKVEDLSELDELMDEDEYQEYIADLD